MSNLKKFNNVISDLISELCELYPSDRDIKIFREKFNMITKVNNQMVLRGFLLHVYPHKQNIMNEDEKFFLSNATDLVKDAADKDDNVSITQALNIKKLWESNMTPETKSAVWKYFKVLIVLSERIVAERTQ
jgi:hypothetical protein